jgi:hypothetical protein
MLETISNIIGLIVKMQLPDGCNLAMEEGPLGTLTLQYMEMAGASPLLLTKMQAPAPAPVQQFEQTPPTGDTILHDRLRTRK